MNNSKEEIQRRIELRLGEENVNNQGVLMKIIEYVGYSDITVEFQDQYKGKVHTTYAHFKSGGVKNPYYPSVYGIGMVGDKYLRWKDSIPEKEYVAWVDVLKRCFSESFKKKNPTYKDVTCCEEWLLYENFYEWLHSQDNFDKWYNNKQWNVDKDILVKGNKLYSPETCCLVSNNVNCLFVKCVATRGDLPIGVRYNKVNKKFNVKISKHRNGKAVSEHIGVYDTSEEAFYAYKEAKESYIKQVAQEEYSLDNITKKCYDAMMSYEVEITD